MRRDDGPVGVRHLCAAPPPHGRDPGDAQDVRLPQLSRQGEVGEESLHRGDRVRENCQLEEFVFAHHA